MRPGPKPVSIADQFAAGFAPPDDAASCWPWRGRKAGNGYGQLRTRTPAEFWLAHRFSWVTHNGPIPSKLVEVRHKCDNPICVNPYHLELGTHAENMRDMKERARRDTDKHRQTMIAKPFCRRGHLKTEENTIYKRPRNGHIHRTCAVCAEESRIEYAVQTKS